MKPGKKFIKLDKRHTGEVHFDYYIPFNRYSNGTNNQSFYIYRNWCWETWGSSKELVYWLKDEKYPIIPVSHNDHWCWQNDEYATRIYLSTEKELSIFLLKWGDQL